MAPFIAHAIDGGWNTELGPSPDSLQMKDERTVSVPYLIDAINIVYEADGWPRKMPGASNVNASATGATNEVIGLFDYWRSTISGAPVQRRVLMAGTAVYSEAGAGTLTSIATGLEASKMPWFAVMEDELIFATTSTIDVPMKWDQTTWANLGGTPPNFSFHVQHKGYLWAAGVDAAKSRLYYSATSDANDWTAASSGSIDVAPDDGDVITGLWSHNGELIVFKGPTVGGYFRVKGSSEADFALVPAQRGTGAVNQQSVIESPGGDLWFWDHFGVHSLDATDRFGDYAPSFLSDAIRGYFTRSLNHSRFDKVWGINFKSSGYALWTASAAGISAHNLILGLDYRFRPARWFLWDAYDVASLGMVLDANRETVPWAGTYTGRVLRMNRTARNVANVAYTDTTTFPFLGYGSIFRDKSAKYGVVSYAPKGATTFTVAWKRDTNTQQTASVSQTGGTALDSFVLDVDVLGGGDHRPGFFVMSGDFKKLQWQLSQGGLNVDFEPHGLEIEFADAGVSYRLPEG